MVRIFIAILFIIVPITLASQDTLEIPKTLKVGYVGSPPFVFEKSSP